MTRSLLMILIVLPGFRSAAMAQDAPAGTVPQPGESVRSDRQLGVPVYSGPQPGEQITAFPLQGVLDDLAGKEIDLVAQSQNGPLVLIFVHERSRPAFALTNTVMRFAATRKASGLTAGMVFLSADLTDTENWLKRVQQHLPSDVAIGISPDGREGPGAWGLNRHVAITVVVCQKNVVTANFALVQPGVDVDGPKIFRAIADVTGGGEVPAPATFSGRPQMANDGRRDEQDPALRPLLAPLIRKTATPEQVETAAKAIIEYAEKHPAARRQISEIANRIIAADRLASYGTPPAQNYLKKWATEFRTPRD